MHVFNRYSFGANHNRLKLSLSSFFSPSLTSSLTFLSVSPCLFPTLPLRLPLPLFPFIALPSSFTSSSVEVLFCPAWLRQFYGAFGVLRFVCLLRFVLFSQTRIAVSLAISDPRVPIMIAISKCLSYLKHNDRTVVADGK